MADRIQQDPSREAGSQGHPPTCTHPASARGSPTHRPEGSFCNGAPAGVSILFLMMGPVPGVSNVEEAAPGATELLGEGNFKQVLEELSQAIGQLFHFQGNPLTSGSELY